MKFHYLRRFMKFFERAFLETMNIMMAFITDKVHLGIVILDTLHFIAGHYIEIT